MVHVGNHKTLVTIRDSLISDIYGQNIKDTMMSIQKYLYKHILLEY